MYLCFIGPYDIVAPWNPGSIHGVYHFLQRVWGLQDKLNLATKGDALRAQDLKFMHKTIKKVGEDIEQIKFNTAVAALMEWLNHLSRKEKISKEEYKTYLLLLAPFAPHITEELWSHFAEASRDDNWSIHQQSWPAFDNKYLEEEEVIVVIQVNGKVIDTLLIQKDILSNKKIVEKLAKDKPKVSRFLTEKTVKKTVHIPGKVINFVT